MMSDMSDWRDKDDLELSSDDITEMIDAGQPVEATGPIVPGGFLVEPANTFVSASMVYVASPVVTSPVQIPRGSTSSALMQPAAG